jgi:carbon storage regulator
VFTVAVGDFFRNFSAIGLKEREFFMLVLTRRPGQSVYIGDDVKITLVEIKGNQVRIGVEAPPSVRIFREEIYIQILEENKSAAALSAEAPVDLGHVANPFGTNPFAGTEGSRKPDALGKLRVEKKKPKGVG